MLMTGSWLIVKWGVVAMLLVSVGLSYVVSVKARIRVGSKTQRILGLTVLTVSMLNLVRGFSSSVVVLRVSYLVAGAAAIGLIVAASLRLFGSQVSLKADG
jgi:hypothetical protein